MKVRSKFIIIFMVILLIFTVITIPAIGKLLQRSTTKLADLSKIDKGNPVFVLNESYEKLEEGELKELPAWKGYDPFGIDLRSKDISNISFKNYRGQLKYASFDTNTIWPDTIPYGFDPDKALEFGKNPGLGVKLLHKQGITGKGVNLAIIDSALLLEHVEYKDNLMLYELKHCLDKTAQMHGSLVVSIAVGKNVGVAPDAKVYYIASTFGNISKSGAELDLSYIADSIKRVLEINNHLSEKEKIKVISVSRGALVTDKGYASLYSAIEEAKKEGVFVITTTPQNNYEFKLSGLGREIYDDPEDTNSYKPGILWANDYYNNYDENYSPDKLLLVPMDSKTYAFSTGSMDYAFSSQGGLSITCPWLAGMYALCIQVQPDLTPEKFIKTAFETGDTREIKHNGTYYRLGTIINPVNLIKTLERQQ